MKDQLIYWFLKGIIAIYGKVATRVKPCTEKAEYMYKMGDIGKKLIETGEPKFMALGMKIAAINLVVATNDIKSLMA